MRRGLVAAALALAILLSWCAVGLGGTGTSSLTARVAVASNCTVAARGIVFGAYDPIVANRTADLNASGSITIACTRGIAPTIALGPGNNAAGGTRRMSNGTGDFLDYQLYQPPDNAAGTPCSFPG